MLAAAAAPIAANGGVSVDGGVLLPPSKKARSKGAPVGEETEGGVVKGSRVAEGLKLSKQRQQQQPSSSAAPLMRASSMQQLQGEGEVLSSPGLVHRYVCLCA